MKRDGLLTDEACVLWERSFEEDNFSVAELTSTLEQ